MPLVSGDMSLARPAGSATVKRLRNEQARRPLIRKTTHSIEQSANRLPVPTPMTVSTVAPGPVDGVEAAQQSGSWIVMTSFRWNDGGQSATVTRTAQFVTDAARPTASQQDAVSDAPARPEGAQGVAASVQKPVQPRQVLVRYAAVPTDLGWLIVQL